MIAMAVIMGTKYECNVGQKSLTPTPFTSPHGIKTLHTWTSVDTVLPVILLTPICYKSGNSISVISGKNLTLSIVPKTLYFRFSWFFSINDAYRALQSFPVFGFFSRFADIIGINRS